MQGSENAGMSSARKVSKPSHRMAKVSSARFILGGLVGPKARPKGVADGQTVDIPLPPRDDQVSSVCGMSEVERRVGVAASKRAAHFGGPGVGKLIEGSAIRWSLVS